MKRILSLLVCSALVSSFASVQANTQPRDEALSYSTINPVSPEVIGAAYFAVARLHEAGQPFQLIQVLKAESQFESGINYRLTLELKLGEESAIHEVVVNSQPWIGAWQLVSEQKIVD